MGEYTALVDMLRGVVAEKGTLVTCSDAPSFEMLKSLNHSRYKQQLISRIFTSTAITDEGAFERNLFVKNIPGMEDEVQAWLDPFRGISKGRKRERVLSSSDDDSSDG